MSRPHQADNTGIREAAERLAGRAATAVWALRDVENILARALRGETLPTFDLEAQWASVVLLRRKLARAESRYTRATMGMGAAR